MDILVEKNLVIWSWGSLSFWGVGCLYMFEGYEKGERDVSSGFWAAFPHHPFQVFSEMLAVFFAC